MTDEELLLEQRKVKAIITVFDFNMSVLRQNILDNVAIIIYFSPVKP